MLQGLIHYAVPGLDLFSRYPAARGLVKAVSRQEVRDLAVPAVTSPRIEDQCQKLILLTGAGPVMTAAHARGFLREAAIGFSSEGPGHVTTTRRKDLANAQAGRKVLCYEPSLPGEDQKAP